MKQMTQFLKGILVGIANVIPGVSGGTMMVILNIYDDFLYAISWKNYKKHLPFLAILVAGILVGILLFSQTITYLLDHYHLPVYYSFIGLVIGSIPMIYKRARHEKVKPRNLSIFLLALVFMLLISSLDSDGGAALTFTVTPDSDFWPYLWLFVASIISTFAMILPGVSGSLIMLLLGAYTVVIEALATFDLLTLLPVALGSILGGYVGLKFIKTLLRYHPQALYFGILGLILGSLVSIYPGPPVGNEGILGLLFMVFFSIIAYFMSK